MSQPSDEKKSAGKKAAHPPASGGSRFVISQLHSHLPTPEHHKAARAAFDACFDAVMKPSVDVVSDSARDEAGRRVLVVRADPQEMYRQASLMPAGTLVEPELPRTPALAEPPVLKLWRSLQGPTPQDAKRGAKLELVLLSGGAPVRDAAVTLLLGRQPPLPGQPSATSIATRSDAEGKVAFEYDSSVWAPQVAVVEPARGAWSVAIQQPSAGQVELPPLPRQGPLGWWHLLMGATRYDETLGAGVRVGIVDTGAGPHPYLSHVQSLGAFVEGSRLDQGGASADARNHGTHVCGLIGARPSKDSGDYAGLAPGAELLVARVFTATGGGGQGDIANAIEALAEREVDLINMSLVGEPSLIERDAIAQALQRGTLCICSAGNQDGAPVGPPGIYPECVAVSAIGLLGTWPEGAVASMHLPFTADKYTGNGLFLASFSNIGSHLACTAPGNAIVSTVPATEGQAAPYADMSGTSMSAALTTGALAVLLSGDPEYKRLGRDWTRAMYARSALTRYSRQLGLSPLYEGYGLARELAY